MDQPWWMASPAPALYVRPRSADFEWELNDAARQWARDSAVSADVLGRVARDVGRRSAAAAAGAVGATALDAERSALRWHSMPWSEGWLAWCLPDELYTPTPQDLLERVDILRQSGRVGMSVRDLRTGEGRWDRNTFTLWGFDPVAGTPHIRDAFQRIHPDDRPHMLARLAPGAHLAGYTDERFRVELPDGGLRYLHAMVQLIPGPDGQLRQMLGVTVDDTETISNYLAQRAAAEEARHALVMANVAVWRLDLASDKVYGNQVCFDRMQREATDEGFDHEWVLSHYHPDDRPLAMQANQRALEGEAVVDAVLRYRYTEGAPYRPLLTRRVARRNAQGLPTELIGVALDIGDNVRLSEEAQASARRAAEIETMAGIGCWTLDPSSGHAEWDAGVFALHGREPARGTPTYSAWVEEYVHPDDRSRLRTALSAQAHVQRKPYTDHCRIVRGDGKVRFLTISGHYTERPEGMILCGTMADITDKHSVSDALRSELTRTRFASESAGLGAWEWDLEGAPLYWNAQMYRLHGLEPHDTRPLSQLWGAAHRPVDLGQLRRAIRLHVEGERPLEHELRTLWPDGSEHWITIRGRVMPGPGGRGERVYGVSWDLTPRKHIERDLRDKEAALSASRARHAHVAKMAESLRDALLGLGQRSNGDDTLHLLEKVDHLLDAIHEPSVVTAHPPAAVRPLTLVCIEDSAVNLMMVEQLAQLRPNVTLHSACNGQAGVELAVRLRPEVVLVDMNLPDLDGIEVLRRLREHPALDGATTIVLSANALQSDIDRAMAAGFDAYWSKPIDREVFLSGLDALSHGHALRHRGDQALAQA
ncbi:MAG TPA: PAS domain-containing protein [Burkholderiaceae bacterium]